jgi:hypothetical protein
MCRTYSFVALGYQTWSKVDELSKLEAWHLSSTPRQKNFFRGHAMSKSKNGFGIAWPPNLHIGSIFFIRGYLNIIWRKKLFYVKIMSNFRTHPGLFLKNFPPNFSRKLKFIQKENLQYRMHVLVSAVTFAICSYFVKTCLDPFCPRLSYPVTKLLWIASKNERMKESLSAVIGRPYTC